MTIKLRKRRWPDFLLRMPGLALAHYRLLRAPTPWGPSTIGRRDAAVNAIQLVAAAVRCHGALMAAENKK